MYVNHQTDEDEMCEKSINILRQKKIHVLCWFIELRSSNVQIRSNCTVVEVASVDL